MKEIELPGNKKPILKTVKQAFKRAVAVFAIVGILFTGAFAIKGAIDNQKYTSSEEVSITAEELGIENLYLLQDSLTNNYRRLAHNGDEPIYVSFSKEFENDSGLKEAAIASLDYLFGIVGKINSNYKYKIVSNFELEKQDLLGKSTIKYQLGSLPNTIAGENIMNLDMQDFAYWDFINSSNRIVIDREIYSQKKGYFGQFNNDFLKNYTTNLLLHELMHVFGFADVYKWGGPEFIMNIFEHIVGEDKIDMEASHEDTFMNPSNVDCDELKDLTVQDYSTLCALYKPKVSSEKRDLEMQRISQLIEDYKDYLYQKKVDYFQKQEEEYIGDICAHTGIRADSFSPIDDFSEVDFSRRVHLYTDDWEDEFVPDDYDYKIKIDSGKYILSVFDKEGDLIDSCSGNVVKTDTFTILEGCEFKDGIYSSYKEGLNLYRRSGDILVFNTNGKPRMYYPEVYFNVCNDIVYNNEAGIE